MDHGEFSTIEEKKKRLSIEYETTSKRTYVIARTAPFEAVSLKVNGS
jgi:hypothetical protein